MHGFLNDESIKKYASVVIASRSTQIVSDTNCLMSKCETKSVGMNGWSALSSRGYAGRRAADDCRQTERERRGECAEELQTHVRT